MHFQRNEHAERCAYAVIQKNRTIIWEDNFEGNYRPITIYDPYSIPRSVHHDTNASSSTYDVANAQRANKEFKLLAGWMRPFLNFRYETRIFDHLREFDQIYLVGGGIGRWSGINNFLAYVNEDHPDFVSRIKHERRFRFTDFPDSALFEIFRKMSNRLH